MIKEYAFNENQIIIKNKNNLKRSIIVLTISVIVAGFVIYHYNPVINTKVLLSRPTLTLHAPLLFVLALIVMIIFSFNYKLFDGNKKILYQHTVFGTKPIGSFDEFGTVKRIDVYNRSVHSRIRYELTNSRNPHRKGVLLDSFLPTESGKIKYFEENVIPKIHQLIQKIQ